METFQMSNKEISRIGVFEKLKNKEMKQKEASMIIGISTRQIRKKLKEFRRLGPKALIHGSRGKPSNNQIDIEIKRKAISLIENKYPDFGPTFASEKLEKNHNLIVNHETLRLMMAQSGLWVPKKRKVTHRVWRERKEHFGELIQLDGSDHDWFEGKAPRCTLLAFIDDATSQITHLEFAGETTVGIMGATKTYIQKHGIPHEIYVDRGKVFKVNLNNEDGDRVTQYQRAIEELGSKMVYARSPQAKGRIERLFRTLQDRLVKELRLRSINMIEEANKFIENEYLPKHNKRYSIESKSDANFHKEAKRYNLEEILCIKEVRILNSDFTLRYKNQWYQLEKKQKTLIFPKNEITIKTHLDGRVSLSIRAINLFFHEIDKAVKEKHIQITERVIEKEPCLASRQAWKPAVDHPWRTDNILKKAELSTLRKAELSTLV